MNSYTLDSSVIIKWFSSSNENDLENALSLRNDIKKGLCIISVPDLLFYEIANALRYNPHFTETDVKDALQSIYDMEFNIVRTDKDIMLTAIDIAFNFKTTVYDATFLATSSRQNSIFITADYKFFDRVKDYNKIIKLSDFESA